MLKPLAILALMASAPAFAATYQFTGVKHRTTIVSENKLIEAWDCQYSFGKDVYWRIYAGSCAPSLDISL